jgi:hypothetical protein
MDKTSKQPERDKKPGAAKNPGTERDPSKRDQHREDNEAQRYKDR